MIKDQPVVPLPDIFIGSEKVNQRANLYLESKHPMLSQALSTGGTQRQDTKSIWYSKEHIQTWLDEINLTDADGMRIYFGAYENEIELAPGQLCLVMMLTRPDGNGSHTDIIYENEPGFEDRLQAAQSRSLPRDMPIEATPRPFNYGSPCPPIC